MKIGEVEFRIVARPASTDCSAHAISVNGNHAVEAGLEQEAAPERGNSLGSATPRNRSTASSTMAAIVVRPAIKVTGGIVSTPTLMNVNDAPHSVASSSSSASSTGRTVTNRAPRAERAVDRRDKRALLAQDQPLRLRHGEILAARGIGLEPRAVTLVCREIVEGDQSPGDVVGPLVRHEIADEIGRRSGE